MMIALIISLSFPPWFLSSAASAQQPPTVPVITVDDGGGGADAIIQIKSSNLPNYYLSYTECNLCQQNKGAWCTLDGQDQKAGTCISSAYSCQQEGMRPVVAGKCDPTMSKRLTSAATWSALILFASWMSLRNFKLSTTPPSNWEPVNTAEVPDAVLQNIGKHVCTEVSAASIDATLDTSNAVQASSSPLFEAGDALTIKGNVNKYSSTCSGATYECEQHIVYGCKVDPKWMGLYFTYENKKCDGRYPNEVEKVSRKNYVNWKLIAAIGFEVLTQIYPGFGEFAAKAIGITNRAGGNIRVSSVAGGAGTIAAFSGSLKPSNKDLDDATEPCYTVCGRIVETTDPSKTGNPQELCKNFVPSGETPLKSSPTDDYKFVSAKPSVLGYNTKNYDSDSKIASGCKANDACGVFAGASVGASVISPSGTSTDLGVTKTDASGAFSFSFNAPNGDGLFNAVVKVKGYPPISKTGSVVSGVKP